MKKTALVALLLAAGLSAYSQVSQWVSYNDHFPGPRTGPNVTGWNYFPTANDSPGSSGFLKNSASGADLSVTMTVTSVVAGATGGTSSSGPAAGTPASLLFTNQIDFGTGGGTNHALQLSGSSKIVHAFSGLDPARRYSWHGTAARGNNYADRWTLLEISAQSWEDAHTMMATGLFTSAQIPSLTSSQAVANFGENRAPGAYAAWTNIVPNSDGTILIYQSSYHGTLPGTFTSGGTYGYAVVADRFEEFVVGTDTQVGITSQPTNLSVLERGFVSFSLTATGFPQHIQWYRKESGSSTFNELPGANSSVYTIASAAYPADNGAQFRAVVSNSLNSVTSSAATLTVIPDTTAPTVVRVIGDLDPTIVHVSFSEPIDPASLDTLNFTIYVRGTDPNSSPYTTESYAVLNSTNVNLTTSARAAGVNYAIRIDGVTDASASHNTMTPTNIDIRATIQVIDFDVDNVWKYDINNGDLFGTGWETVGYDDSAWPEGPSGLGHDASVNGVPIRTDIPYMSNSVPVFFRRHFTLPANPTGVQLTLRDVVEDGAVYFINGKEAYRHNVSAGTLSLATRSTASQTDPTPIQGPFSIPATNLVQGDNLIAVVVVQSGNTSSDIELAVELTAEIDGYATGAPSIATQPQNVTVNEGGTATLTALVGGASPLTMEWRKGIPPGGTAVAGATSSVLTFSPARPSESGDYYLHVSNAIGSTNSAVAHVTIVADSTVPVVLHALALTNGTEVLVSFSEAILPSSVSTAAFQFNPALNITSAAVTNATNVLLTFDARTPNTAYTVHISPGTLSDFAEVPNRVAEVTVPVLIPITAVPMLDYQWRWLGDGSDPGAGWQSTSFSDAAWLLGTNLFEAKRGTVPVTLEPLIRTTMNISNVANTTNVFTYYFRTHFNWSGAGAAALQIAHYIDDGAVVYLNGQEIYRIGITNPAPVPYLALANRTVGDADVEGPFVVPLAGLVNGDNLLAVEAHQSSGTSSDATMSLGLDVLVTSFGASGPRLQVSRNATTGAVTITWPSGTLQQSTALQAGGAGWSDVPGSPTSPYTFTPSGGMKFFRAR